LERAEDCLSFFDISDSVCVAEFVDFEAEVGDLLISFSPSFSLGSEMWARIWKPF
jgi:hypothetical protein